MCESHAAGWEAYYQQWSWSELEQKAGIQEEETQGEAEKWKNLSDASEIWKRLFSKKPQISRVWSILPRHFARI